MSVSADGARGVFCLTFDNLGEAAELGDGKWPAGAPIGDHFTVDAVERLLELLSWYELSATFFVEAFNAKVYPELLLEIAGAGHEIGCHAWKHEHWVSLSAEREREVLSRSTEALRELDLDPVGLRPPGGLVTERTADLLAEFGYMYYSPAGTRAGVASRLAVIPFRWDLVDAFFYAPAFGGLREDRGKSREPLSTGSLVGHFTDAIDAGASSGAQTTLLFHSMFLDEVGPCQALEDVLRYARRTSDAGRAEFLRMRDFAARMLAAPDVHGAPEMDTSSWM